MSERGKELALVGKKVGELAIVPVVKLVEYMSFSAAVRPRPELPAKSADVSSLSRDHEPGPLLCRTEHSSARSA